MKRNSDKLIIKNQDKELEFEVLAANLDRSFVYSDHGRKENIDGYSLIIDSENLSNDVIRDIQEITGHVNEFFKVNLSIDGEQKEGHGKISGNFTLFGLSVDLELHSQPD